MNNFLVSIIIVNFNGEKYLDSCLRSVLKSAYKNFEIILVDDGSVDNSLNIVEKFQRIDSRIILLKNKKNIGAAASRNKAVVKARGSIVVFLDNDTEVTFFWLDELVKSLSPDEVGAAQALLIDFNKRDTIQMAGGMLIPYTAWLIPFYQDNKYAKIRDKLTDKKIVAVSATLAVKKAALDIVKKFDEKEGIYTEDLDFCWRIWIAGYKVVLSPNSIVYHYTKSVSQRAHMGANYLQIYYHLSKNSLRSMIKNYEFQYMLINIFYFVVLNFVRGILVLIRRFDFSAIAGAMAAIMWNIIHIKDTLKNRAIIQKTRVVSDDYLYGQIFTKDSLVKIYNRHFRETKLLW